jgi:alpha-beta hydrolase superfamily lysophospholipase
VPQPFIRLSYRLRVTVAPSSGSRRSGKDDFEKVRMDAGAHQREKEFTFTDAEDWQIFARRWLPIRGTPRAIVQIVHGVADHSGRYRRFAEILSTAGYAVYANDHRGHGRTAKDRKRFGIAGKNGWNGMIADLKLLSDLARSEQPGVPLFLFAHSLGSLMAQQYLQQWGTDLHGAILSGTLGSLAKLDERLAMILPQAEGENAERSSPVFTALQASFNQPFEPGDTWLDWLTRDINEVRAYAADPLCRVAVCNRLAADILIGGKKIWTSEQESKIPRLLPLLVIAGEKDPVGEMNASVKTLVDRYRQHGMTRIACKFYPNARHELLNELNREEVQQDILGWIAHTQMSEVQSPPGKRIS